MGLADISSRDAVLDAIDEYEDLGADAFLQRYGDGLSRALTIEYVSQNFAALPVLRVAHRVVAGELLSTEALSDLRAAKTTLESLGFRILGDAGPPARSAGARSGASRLAGTARGAGARRSPTERQATTAPDPRRSLLEWTMQPGELRTRRELASAFGASLHGVVDPSPRSSSVLVFAAASSALDGWTTDGQLYRLTGEGRRGDQTWTQGNQALLDHQQWPIRLFEECDEAWRPGGKRFEFIGSFRLDPDQPWTMERAADAEDVERAVICFRLRQLP